MTTTPVEELHTKQPNKALGFVKEVGLLSSPASIGSFSQSFCSLLRTLLSYSRFHAVCVPFGSRASPTGTGIAGGTIQ